MQGWRAVKKLKESRKAKALEGSPGRRAQLQVNRYLLHRRSSAAHTWF
jgi:hypothetical protein